MEEGIPEGKDLVGFITLGGKLFNDWLRFDGLDFFLEFVNMGGDQDHVSVVVFALVGVAVPGAIFTSLVTTGTGS